MGTIGLVMLIACANVTNLLLVRIEARRQELLVRAALGASWGRMVRALLVESGILGLMGGVLGVAFAFGGVRLLLAIGPANLPRLSEISLDARTLGFTVLLALLSGLLLGLIPALKYAGPQASFAMRSGGRAASASRERHRARSILVVGQVGMALVLLVSAGLMIRTFQALRTVDPGFTDARHLQVMRISIPEALVPEPERVMRIQNEILEKLAAIPGVKSAGFVSEMPMEGFDSDWDCIFAQDKTYPDNVMAPLRLYKYISPGFLQTAGTRLIAGREFTWSDVYGLRPVVTISENLARETWGTPSAASGETIARVPVHAMARSDWRDRGCSRKRRAGEGARNRLLAAHDELPVRAQHRGHGADRDVCDTQRARRGGGLSERSAASGVVGQLELAAGERADDAGGLRQISGADFVHPGDARDRRS